MRVWRICKRLYRDTSFSGIGGLKGPARWHHQGNLIVYTSASLSLATLESWVQQHLKRPLQDYVSVSAVIPDAILIEEIDEKALPVDWRLPSGPSSSRLRDIGTTWLLRGAFRSYSWRIQLSAESEAPRFPKNQP